MSTVLHRPEVSLNQFMKYSLTDAGANQQEPALNDIEATEQEKNSEVKDGDETGSKTNL